MSAKKLPTPRLSDQIAMYRHKAIAADERAKGAVVPLELLLRWTAMAEDLEEPHEG